MRHLINTATAIAAMGYEGADDADSIMDKAENDFRNRFQSQNWRFHTY